MSQSKISDEAGNNVRGKGQKPTTVVWGPEAGGSMNYKMQKAEEDQHGRWREMELKIQLKMQNQ